MQLLAYPPMSTDVRLSQGVLNRTSRVGSEFTPLYSPLYQKEVDVIQDIAYYVMPFDVPFHPHPHPKTPKTRTRRNFRISLETTPHSPSQVQTHTKEKKKQIHPNTKSNSIYL